MTDTRNVADRFKGWETQLIRDELDINRLPFITAIENVNGDFNKACIVRSHNVFSGKEIWIIGRKGWDTRGSVGAKHYEWIHHFPTWKDAWVHYFDNVYTPGLMAGYHMVGIEQDPDAGSIVEHVWNPNTIMVYGEEGSGLSQEALDLCNKTVYIPQRGSIRSLNVATAAGIAMYDYSVKTGLL